MKKLLILFLLAFSLSALPLTYADDVERIYIEDLLDDDRAIISDKYGDKYMIEYGIGCLSIWRYEDDYVYIEKGSFIDGIGDTIYLPDEDGDCRVWDAEEIDNSHSYYSPPIIPSNESNAMATERLKIYMNAFLNNFTPECVDPLNTISPDKFTEFKKMCLDNLEIGKITFSQMDLPQPQLDAAYFWIDNTYRPSYLQLLNQYEPKCGKNATYSVDGCYCNSGFEWKNNDPKNTECVAIKADPTPRPTKAPTPAPTQTPAPTPTEELQAIPAPTTLRDNGNMTSFAFKDLRFKKINGLRVFAKKAANGTVVLLWAPVASDLSLTRCDATIFDGKKTVVNPIFRKKKLLIFKSQPGQTYAFDIHCSGINQAHKASFTAY